MKLKGGHIGDKPINSSTEQYMVLLHFLKMKIKDVDFDSLKEIEIDFDNGRFELLSNE